SRLLGYASSSADPVLADLQPLLLPGRSALNPGDRRNEVQEEASLHPTGKPHPNQPTGSVAVQSDSALSEPTVSPLRASSDSDLTTDLSPGPPGAPATKRDTPTAFGRYVVRGTLGAGGFGAVYLGHDTQLDRPVAIKVLHGRTQVQQTETDRLPTEGRQLAHLSH